MFVARDNSKSNSKFTKLKKSIENMLDFSCKHLTIVVKQMHPSAKGFIDNSPKTGDRGF